MAFKCTCGASLRVTMSAGTTGFGGADYEAICPTCQARTKIANKAIEVVDLDRPYSLAVEHNRKTYTIKSEGMNIAHPDEAFVDIVPPPPGNRFRFKDGLVNEQLAEWIEDAIRYIDGI